MILKAMQFTAILTLVIGFGSAVVACFMATWQDMGWWAVLLWWVSISIVVSLFAVPGEGT